jgi:hypothetical protein
MCVLVNVDPLFKLLFLLQNTTRCGLFDGKVSLIQLENEYGALTEDGSEEDVDYLKFLKEDYEKHGIVELLYTSDNPTSHAERGSLPGGRHSYR